jgi:hypothetical protein
MHFYTPGRHVLSSVDFARVQIHTTYNYMDLNNITHILGVVNVHLLPYYQRFGGTHCLYPQGAAVQKSQNRLVSFLARSKFQTTFVKKIIALRT